MYGAGLQTHLVLEKLHLRLLFRGLHICLTPSGTPDSRGEHRLWPLLQPEDKWVTDFLRSKIGDQNAHSTEVHAIIWEELCKASPGFDPYLGLNKWQLSFLLFLLNPDPVFPR